MRSYDWMLRHKLALFSEKAKTKPSPHPTFTTTYGLKRKEYSCRVQRIVTIDDLFV